MWSSRSDERSQVRVTCALRSLAVRTGRGVMINCMCQLVGATMPRYLVKHDSGCFFEGVFG